MKRNLSFTLFRGSDEFTHTHQHTQMPFNNTCKQKPTHLCCGAFWQWPCFAWGVDCIWLCGWGGNLGTNCCSVARNLLPWTATGSCTALALTSHWDDPVRWNLFSQKCLYLPGSTIRALDLNSLLSFTLPNSTYSIRKYAVSHTVNLSFPFSRLNLLLASYLSWRL